MQSHIRIPDLAGLEFALELLIWSYELVIKVLLGLPNMGYAFYHLSKHMENIDRRWQVVCNEVLDLFGEVTISEIVGYIFRFCSTLRRWMKDDMHVLDVIAHHDEEASIDSLEVKLPVMP
ncbi:hypothetical protein VNO77_08754 [Canavalia gladiata]|uniref:Uncharacterized protein n=1 Tax=Canavalia gladiata TaxID=3824 RepID=A0AAN9MCG0_CANGL